MTSKIDEFRAMYAPKLKEVYDKHPLHYRFDYATTLANMLHALETKGVASVNIDSIPWRHCAKKLKMANTYTNWKEWFNA